MQAGVDSIYHTFKTRVADGRKASMARIDSLAQGRVWTGTHAQRIGLVDELGGLNKAIEGAARLAKLKAGEYKVREYPEPKSFLEQLMEEYEQNIQVKMLSSLLSPDEIKWVKETRWMKKNIAIPQTRLPFQISVQ